MTQKELLYVKTIADEMSISKAAKKLFIAQPSLSQALQRIENSLGTQLFLRTPSGLKLSFSGEKYYQMATNILKMYSDFESEISDLNDLKTGRITLGITNYLGNVILPQILPEFKKKYPNIELYVVEENSAMLEQKLVRGQIDFAIMHAPKYLDSSTFNYDYLLHDPFILVTSPDAACRKMAKQISSSPYPVLDPAVLCDENFIMVHKEQRIRQITDAILIKAGIPCPNIILTLKSYQTAQLLAMEGLGVVFIPQQYAQLISGAPESCILSIDPSYDASWDLCITTMKNNFLPKSDQLFIDMVRALTF